MRSISLQYCEELLRKAGLLTSSLEKNEKGMVILSPEQRKFLEDHARSLLQQQYMKVQQVKDQAEAKRERKARKRLRDDKRNTATDNS